MVKFFFCDGKEAWKISILFQCNVLIATGVSFSQGFHCESFLPDAFIDRATGPNRADGYSDSTSKRKQCDRQRCETPRAKRCSSIKDRLSTHVRWFLDLFHFLTPLFQPLLNSFFHVTCILYFLEKFKEMQQVKLSAPKRELHSPPTQRFYRRKFRNFVLNYIV